MTVIGSASIDIRANDRYFEPDVRRAVAKIKNVNIDLRVNADMSAANKKIRDLRYRMSKNEIQIPIRANDAKFDADVRAAVRKIRNVQIDLKADVDVAKASKKIRDLRYRITRNDAVLKVDANLAKAEEKMRKFLEKFVEKEINFHAKAHTQGAHTALSELQTRYGGPVQYTARANTAIANAALAWAARNRMAKITAIVDPKAVGALKGLMNALTGTLPYDKIRDALTGFVSNFEGAVTKATALTSAITAASGAALTLGANIFSIAGDITHVVGIAAMLPATFIALGAAIAATKMSWKGFGEALSDDPEKAAKAMAKLPPQAQEAANAVRGLGKEIQQATQVEFWVAMESTLQDMVTTLFPELKAGMEDVGSSLGSLQGATFKAIEEAFDDGVLRGVLRNVSQMLMNMSDGAEAGVRAFATLGRVGSTYLPRLGEWLSELGVRFNNFIQQADDAGKINQWIGTAVRRFQELGSVVGSTSSILKSITDVARMSGAPGLTEFADGLRDVAKTASSEPFQSQLLDIFVGARAGTDRLGEGLSTLTEYFWESSESVRAFLEISGEIAGLTFENITNLFDGTSLGSGLYSALSGFRDGLAMLGPGMRDFGSAIGGVGEIAGELFRNMAPGLNLLAETLNGVVTGLKNGIIDAMPVFNTFVQAVMALVSGPVVALADMMGSVLTTFSQLPGAIQNVLMGLGLFLLLKPKFTNFFGALSASINNEGSNVGRTFANMRNWASTSSAGIRSSFAAAGQGIAGSFGIARAGTQLSMALMRETVAQSGREITGVLTRTGVEGSRGFAAGMGTMLQSSARAAGAVAGTLTPARLALSNLAVHAGNVGKSIGTSITRGIGVAASGLMGALGGPWGLAIMGATMAIGAFAQANAKSKAEVDALKGSLEQQTGAFTAATEKLMGEQILDFDRSGFKKFGDGLVGASEDVDEILNKMGISLDGITKKLSDTKGAQDYMDAWDEIAMTLQRGGDVSDELAARIGSSADQLNNLNSFEFNKVANNVIDTGEKALKAAEDFEKLANQMGVSTVEAQRLSNNYAVLEDTTSSVSQKVSALKSNLDILSDGKRTAANAAKEYYQSLDDTRRSLEELNQREGVALTSLVDVKNGFDMTSQAGRDLHTALEGQADAILNTAMTAFQQVRDAGGTMEEATVAATQAMDAPIQKLREQLSTFGFEPGQIDKILADLDLLDREKIEMAITADGDEAIREAARVDLAMKAFASNNYEAALGALPGNTMAVVAEALGLAEEYANGEYEAIISALDDTPGGIEAALANLLTFDGTDVYAYMKANNMIPEEIEKTQQMMADMTDEKSIDLLVNDTATAALEGINTYNFEGKQVDLSANDSVSDVINNINAANIGNKVAEITPMDYVTEVINHINNTVMDGKMTEIQARDLATETMNQLEARSIDGKFVDITANDLASMVISNVAYMEIPGKDTVLTATDNTNEGIQSAANSLLTGVPSVVSPSIYANDFTAPGVGSATNTMATTPNVFRDIAASDRTAAGKALAMATMGSTPNVERDLTSADRTRAGVSAAFRTMLGLQHRTVDLNANDKTGNAVQSAKNAIGSVVGKTVDIVTRFLRVGDNAVGGIWDGSGNIVMAKGGIMKGAGDSAVQAFANGGINRGVQQQALKAFAGGGVENHTAQIARGAWPVRVWAEPETGGEAYIPLSKAKRKRSLDILKVVMAEFGLGHLTREFADGGIMKGAHTPKVVSARYAAPTPSTSAPQVSASGRTLAAPQIHVHPSQGLSEEQIGTIASDQLWFQIQNASY